MAETSAIVAEGIAHSVDANVAAPTSEGRNLVVAYGKNRKISTLAGNSLPPTSALESGMDSLIADPAIRDQAKEAIRRNGFVEQGGTTLETLLKGSPNFRKNIEAVINSDPALAKMYADFATDDDRIDFLVKRLGQADVKTIMARKQQELLSPDGVAGIFDGNTSEATQVELTQKEQELKDATARQKELEDQLKKDREELEAFQGTLDTSGTTPVWKEGAIAAELAKLRATASRAEINGPELEAVRNAIAGLEKLHGEYLALSKKETEGSPAQTVSKAGGAITTTVSGMDAEVKYFTPDISKGPAAEAVKAIEAKIAAKKLEQTNLQTENDNAAKAAEQIRALEARRTALETRIRDNAAELVTVKDRIAALPKEIAEKTAELRGTPDIKMVMAQYVADLQNVVPEALSEALNAQAETLYDKQVEIAAKAAEANRESALGRTNGMMLGRLYDANYKPRWGAFNTMYGHFINGREHDAMAYILGSPAAADDLRDKYPAEYAQALTEAKVQVAQLRTRQKEPRIVAGGHLILGERIKPISEGERQRMRTMFKPSELQRRSEIPGIRDKIEEATGIALDPDKPIDQQIEGAGGNKWLMLAILLGIVIPGTISKATA